MSNVLKDYKYFFDLLRNRGIEYYIDGSDIRVCDSFNLWGCRDLECLPDGLTIMGGIGLTMCTSLTSLPSRMRVEGGMRLDGCTGIRKLPTDLYVGGDLSLEGCTLYPFDPKTLCIVGKIRGVYGTVPNSVRFISGED